MNTQPRHPKCRALPVEPHPDIHFSAMIPRRRVKIKFFLSVVIPVVKAAFMLFSAIGGNPANAGVTRLCGVSPHPIPDTATALPKQARYQLRNTPTSGGTAAPPEYSISFFARFVNMESAVRGIGAFRLFQPIKAAVRKRAMTGIFCKRRGFGATAEKRMQKLDRTQNLLRSSCKQAGKVLS